MQVLWCHTKQCVRSWEKSVIDLFPNAAILLNNERTINYNYFQTSVHLLSRQPPIQERESKSSTFKLSKKNLKQSLDPRSSWVQARVKIWLWTQITIRFRRGILTWDVWRELTQRLQLRATDFFSRARYLYISFTVCITCFQWNIPKRYTLSCSVCFLSLPAAARHPGVSEKLKRRAALYND